MLLTACTSELFPISNKEANNGTPANTQIGTCAADAAVGYHSPEQAFSFSTDGEDFPMRLPTRFVCRDRDDWFHFEIPANAYMQFDINYDLPGTRVNLEYYREEYPQALWKMDGSSQSDREGLKSTGLNTASGAYYVRVFTDEEIAQYEPILLFYTNTPEQECVYCAPGTQNCFHASERCDCSNDDLEPNDSPLDASQAIPLSFNLQYSAKACLDEEDWYVIHSTQAGVLILNFAALLGAQPQYHMNVAVLKANDSENPLAYWLKTASHAEWSVRLPAPGSYYIRARNAWENSFEYSFSLAIE